MKLLCYKNIKVSINIFLQQMYRNLFFILQSIINAKHSKNKNLELLISYSINRVFKLN